ncbi:MAG: AAA family ATPase [Clostridia bacterium]|nr:AAA family ATPase [Clostridia bacterium]
MNEVIAISRDASPFDQTFREPPHSLEAEQAFLGGVMADNRVLDGAAFLKPEHFALAAHACIYEAILALRERGRVADPLTVKPLVENLPVIVEAGGVPYLVGVASAAVGRLNAIEYARLIRDLWVRREMIAVGQDIVAAGYTPDFDRDAMAIWTDAEARVEALTEVKAPEEPGTLERLEEIYKNPGKLLGVSCGLTALDNLLCGFQAGQLILLAGRPSMGKTTLAASMARKAKAGDDPAKVAFFTLEQSKSEIEIKIISDLASVPMETMRRGTYADASEFGRVVDAHNRLRKMPLAILGRSGMTPAEIRAEARHIKRRLGGLDAVFVDQLTHIAPPDKRTTNRVHQIGEILKPLKAMARELGVPVVLLHQLSRGVEARENKRPTLQDLRDSGEIEQDADVVMFVYREAYYLERDEPVQPDVEDYEGPSDRDYQAAIRKREAWERNITRARTAAEVIVAKQRMGPIDTVTLYYDGRLSRFGDVGRYE